MKRIALKIDVDTLRGTLVGVPNLVAALQRHTAQASFFFSLGPDRSGRDRGSDSLSRYYDLRTRLSGLLWPAPDIGVRAADVMRQVMEAGFETGIHAWDRAAFERGIMESTNAWSEEQMSRACARYADIFATNAYAHAAPGWRMSRHALRLTQRRGFAYASDCRGVHPFRPVVDGELIDCPQLPTTLPSIDEILTLEPQLPAEQIAARITQLSLTTGGDHVFTLRAELEGIAFLPLFEQLLQEWRGQACEIVGLRDIHATLDVGTLPRHSLQFVTVPGRTGYRLAQGPRFLE